MSELNTHRNFYDIARNCNSDNQKIDFFDNYYHVFAHVSEDGKILVDKTLPNDIDDAFYVYANMKRMSQIELDDLRELSCRNYPTSFKVFLFDFFLTLIKWTYNIQICNFIDIVNSFVISSHLNPIIYLGDLGFVLSGYSFFGSK